MNHERAHAINAEKAAAVALERELKATARVVRTAEAVDVFTNVIDLLRQAERTSALFNSPRITSSLSPSSVLLSPVTSHSPSQRQNYQAHQLATDEAIAAANARTTTLSREHAAASGAATAEVVALAKALQLAREAATAARAECGELEENLQSHCVEIERLAAETERSVRRADDLEDARSVLHHDWCASEAAVANLEVSE